ncbi:MAG: PQQ-dependent sugar dehydrogenase [Bacteroidota bacterium]
MKLFRISKLILLVAFAFISCGSQNNGSNPVTEETDFTVDTLATGLQNPWGLEFLPDGRILIVERPGRLRIWQDGQLQQQPVGGIPQIWAHGQGGLLDVKMHPDYDQNGWIYFAYSTPGNGGGNTAVGRGRLQDSQLEDFEEIFVGQPFTSGGAHFGSRVVFDQDNYLYTTIGDRGKQNTAQDLGNHHGTVMRMFDDGSIPPDNPFVDQQGAMPEIWSYGHRNIQGMVFHPETGDLWTHEHGPKGGDEINVIEKGENYGWPEATHGINYNGTIITPDTTLPGMVDPILHWTPSIAPCGLDIVTSDKFPQWEGDLLVGALAGQHIQRVEIEGREVTQTEKILQGFARFRAIRQGPDGYIYILTESPGMMVRLVPASE